MDGNRFDDLSRKFATGLTRRRAITSIAAGLAGALGLRGGAEGQVSQAYCGDVSCRTNPSKCKEGCVCCVWPNKNSRCMPPNRCGEAIVCAPGKVADPIRGCVDPCIGTGTGTCTQPTNPCQVSTCAPGGLCVVGPAPNNTACGANNICCGGTCVANTSTSNCRTCGTTCSGNTPVCNATTGCVQCATAANCPPPNTAICQGAATCNAGVCQYGTAANNSSCGSGKVCCGGTCTVNTTVTNCGTCGNACSANQVCTGGTCTCPNATCNGACCAAGQVCIGGICSPRGGPGDVCDAGQDGDCQAGLTCCNGRCRNLQTSLNHCGACFNDCPNATPGTCQGARTCTAGVCGFNPADQGTTCRPADSSGCDVAEVCNGSSLVCPADGKAPDNTTCGSEQNCCNGICCDDDVAFCGPGRVCVECLDASTCPQPTNQCQIATCSGNVCGFANKADGATCNDNNACTQTDTCQAGVCTGGNPVVCTASDQCHDVGTCNPATGVCSNPPKTDGTICNDGNACTNNDICTAGICAGTLVDGCVLCTTTADCANVPVSQCQEAVCGPNGTCVVQNRANGVACDDGLFCTVNDTCQAGACVGGPAPDCSEFTDQCNTGVCDETLNACVAQPVSNGTTCDDGLYCTVNDVCTAGACGGTARDCSSFSGQCTVGVCDEDANTCVAQPANVGQTCSDGNLCTTGETCQANGTCGGGTATGCTALDQCHDVGTCDPATGVCSNPNKANGTACNDGNACTQTDTCQAGTCTGGNLVVCDDPPNTQCFAPTGTCNPANGTCSYTAFNGTPCNDSNACTSNDVCTAGTCAGTPIPGCVLCTTTADCVNVPVANQCQEAVCGPNGTCVVQNKANGVSCNDANACTQTDTCQAGVCTGTSPVTCNTPPNTLCYSGPGTCNPATGLCSYTPVANGTACDDGLFCTTGTTCTNGTCGGGTPTCSTAQCLTCNETSDICVSNCTSGQTCNGSGTCVTNCGAAGSGGCTGTIGTQGSCCNGLTCGEGNVCVEPCTVNRTGGCVCTSSTQCPTTGATCCRAVGSGAQCKPGAGACIP